MLSIHITPEARLAILEQFDFLGLRDPGIFLYREASDAEVVRGKDRQAQWNIQRNLAYNVQFVDLPPESLTHPDIFVVEGIRVLPGPMRPQQPNTVALLSFEDGRLYVNDVPTGTHSPDPLTRGRGAEIGPVFHGDVLSSSGNHRFRLVYFSRGGGYDFHSVRLEKSIGSSWTIENCVTRDEFQGQHRFRRCISGLHPTQDDSGNVIIKVGECSHPIDPPGSSTVFYSWREWDLRNNVEIRRLKDCDNPFDPLE